MNTANQINQSRYISRLEAFLVHTGHFVWLEMKKARQSKDVHQEMALYEGVECIWEAKKRVRALKAAQTEKLNAYFAEYKAA